MPFSGQIFDINILGKVNVEVKKEKLPSVSKISNTKTIMPKKIHFGMANFAPLC